MQRLILGISVLIAALAGFISAQFIGTTPTHALISVVFLIVLMIPSAYGFVRERGFIKGILGLISLGLFAFLFESLALKTGVPYGHFAYSDLLGPTWMGLAPFTVPFAWTPFILLAGMITERFKGGWLKTVLFGTLILLVCDLIVDPIAVKVGFWHWERVGVYYGIPLSNFLGWMLSGAIGMGIWRVYSTKKRDSVSKEMLAFSALSTISFFTGLGIYYRFLIPVLCGVGLIVYVLRRDKSGN